MQFRRILKSQFIVVSMAGALLFSCQSQPVGSGASAKNIYTSEEVPSSIYEGVAFDMPKVDEPKFPAYSVDIKDFGAKGDGITNNSEAIANAIADVAAKGGGSVVIPAGIWLTGPIVLKSNINLFTEKGALVVFSKNYDEYPLIQTSYEGRETYRCLSPIYGKDLQNIAITGQGVFDGSGDAWRPVKKVKMTDGQWNNLIKSGGVVSDNGSTWFPTEQHKQGYYSGMDQNITPSSSKAKFEAVRDFLRPVMVSLVNCNKVLLDGPTFQNSPAWNLHPLMCENVIIRNLTVKNPWYAQNGDGLDLESCKNVLIYNNSFDVGDDGICFKSGRDKTGRDRGMPTENVIVKDNIVYHGHGGFVIGSEMSGGVRNVHVSNCTFMGTDIGLRFKSTRGRGGIVENIYISDIKMIDIPTEPIRFNMFYQGSSPIPEEGEEESMEELQARLEPVTEETPVFRNIFMKNITATGSGQAALFLGLPEMNLKNVTLENSVLEAKRGITLVDSDAIKFENVKVLAEEGPALTIYNSKNINITGLAYAEEQMPVVKLLGRLTENIKFNNKDFRNISEQVTRGKDLSSTSFIVK